jgi:hypothetical protein
MSSETSLQQEKVTMVNAKIGMRVVRGFDWTWYNHDGGAGNRGSIVEMHSCGWVTVKWDNVPQINNFRIGAENAHDLYVVPDDPLDVTETSLSLPAVETFIKISVSEYRSSPGVKVVRGRDWKWGDRDGGDGNAGTMLRSGPNGWFFICWDGSKTPHLCRVGAENAYDLYFA